MKTERISLLVLITAVVFLITACKGERQAVPTAEGTYPVEPLFQGLYNQLGGQATLGPAISPLLSENGNYYQYTSASLMEYDPQMPEAKRARLYPLGLEMGVGDNPRIYPPGVNGRFVEGFLVYDKFVPLFDRLGGVSVVGRPLGEVHWNTGKNRYEQYFENVGFFWIDGDAESAVYLLAYGDWKCGQQCQNRERIDASIDIPISYVTPIRTKALSLGLEFTGLPLTAPSLGEDGRVEQLYENVLLASDIQASADVRLIPLPELVGRLREAPSSPDPKPGMLFVPIEENLGYNVPVPIDEYIKSHGGYELVGLPISHVSRMNGSRLEQCFVNMCLQGDLQVDGTLAVSPVPLGYDNDSLTQVDDVTIRTWESKPLVAPHEEQELGVIVLSGGVPAAGVAIELGVHQPDGDERIYQLPPTDDRGESKLKLDPMNAKSGTLVPYKACAQLKNQQRFCVIDSFVIWDIGRVEITPTLPPYQTSYLPFVMRNLHLYLPAFLNHYLTYMPFVGK